MIKINFSKGKIIISMLLCFLPVVIGFYAWLYYDLIFKLTSTIWILVAATVFYLRLKQLSRYRRGEAALTIDKHTLLNNSVLKPQQIPWTDIDYFVNGLYRTNSIFIKLNDLSSLKKEKTSGLIYLLSFIDRNLSTKPASFWIDMDVIDIKEKELISMLLQRLKK